MWGWQAAEGIISSDLSMGQAKDILNEFGFHVYVENDQHVILKNHGKSAFYINGKYAAQQLSLAKRKNGFHIQLRYDTFVLFDMGDLEQYLDEIAKKIGQAEPSEQLFKIYHYTKVSNHAGV